VPVLAEPVVLGTIHATVSATGVVETLPGGAFTAVASEPGRIAEITKAVGDSVQSGDTLVRVENQSIQAQAAINSATIKALEGRVRQARLQQDRIRELVAKGAASQAEMSAADRDVEAAEAELSAAQSALGLLNTQSQNLTIRAPFTGTVTERHHNPGDSVRADESDPILRLIDPRQVHVAAIIPIADAARFVVGASARAVASSTPELLRVSSRPPAESGAKTVPIALAFESPTDLKPGTQVGLEIDAEQRSNVPLVPAVAVLKDANGPVVVVAAGTTAERRPVVVGLQDASQIEIRSGLKPGELVLTQGHTSLRDGTSISVSAP
jgi:RND family efflux transporter MFP subunit